MQQALRQQPSWRRCGGRRCELLLGCEGGSHFVHDGRHAWLGEDDSTPSAVNHGTAKPCVTECAAGLSLCCAGAVAAGAVAAGGGPGLPLCSPPHRGLRRRAAEPGADAAAHRAVHTVSLDGDGEGDRWPGKLQLLGVLALPRVASALRTSPQPSIPCACSTSKELVRDGRPGDTFPLLAEGLQVRPPAATCGVNIHSRLAPAGASSRQRPASVVGMRGQNVTSRACRTAEHALCTLLLARRLAPAASAAVHPPPLPWTPQLAQETQDLRAERALVRVRARVHRELGEPGLRPSKEWSQCSWGVAWLKGCAAISGLWVGTPAAAACSRHASRLRPAPLARPLPRRRPRGCAAGPAPQHGAVAAAGGDDRRCRHAGRAGRHVR